MVAANSSFGIGLNPPRGVWSSKPHLLISPVYRAKSMVETYTTTLAMNEINTSPYPARATSSFLSHMQYARRTKKIRVGGVDGGVEKNGKLRYPLDDE